MPLKYTCPRCGTSHRNIEKSLLGSKVRCACGKIIRLGKKRESAHQADLGVDPVGPSSVADSPVAKPSDPVKPPADPALPVDLQPGEMGSQYAAEPEEIRIRSGWDIRNPAVNVIRDGSGSSRVSHEEQDHSASDDQPASPPAAGDSSPFEVIEDSEVFEILDEDSDPVVELAATPPESAGAPAPPIAPREYGFEVLEDSDEGGPDTLASQSTPDSSVYNEDGLASPLADEPVPDESATQIPEATPVPAQSLRSTSPVPQPVAMPLNAVQPSMPPRSGNDSTGSATPLFEIALFITCILTIVFAAGLAYSSFLSASIHYELAKNTRGASLPWFLFGVRGFIAIGMLIFAGMVMADMYLVPKNAGQGVRLAKPLLMGSAITALAMQILLFLIVAVGASPLRYSNLSVFQSLWTIVIVAAPILVIALLVTDLVQQKRKQSW